MIESFNNTHLEEFNLWWRDQEGYCVPDDLLTKNGIVVKRDGEAVAMGFLIMTDSSVCLFEYIVASPKIRGKEREDALNELFDSAINKARELGFQSIFTFTNNKQLVSRMEKSGFKVADKDVVSLTYNLRGS